MSNVKTKVTDVMTDLIHKYFTSKNYLAELKTKLDNAPSHLQDITNKHYQRALETFNVQAHNLLVILRSCGVFAKGATIDNLEKLLKESNINTSDDRSKIEDNISEMIILKMSDYYNRVIRLTNSESARDVEAGEKLLALITQMEEKVFKVDFKETELIQQDFEHNIIMGRNISKLGPSHTKVYKNMSSERVIELVEDYFMNIRNINIASANIIMSDLNKHKDSQERKEESQHFLDEMEKENEVILGHLSALMENGQDGLINKKIIDEYMKIVLQQFDPALLNSVNMDCEYVIEALKGFDEDMIKLTKTSIMDTEEFKQAFNETLNKVKENINASNKVRVDKQKYIDGMEAYFNDYFKPKNEIQENPKKPTIFGYIKQKFNKFMNNIKRNAKAREIAKGITESVNNSPLEEKKVVNPNNTIEIDLGEKDLVNGNDVVVEKEETSDPINDKPLEDTVNEVEVEKDTTRLTSVLNEVGKVKAKEELINTLNKVKETKTKTVSVENKPKVETKKTSKKAEGLYDGLTQENKDIYDAIIKKSFTKTINNLNDNELIYLHGLFKEEVLRIMDSGIDPKNLTQGEVQALAIYTKLKNKYNKLLKDKDINLDTMEEIDHKTQADLLDMIAKKSETGKGRR